MLNDTSDQLSWTFLGQIDECVVVIGDTPFSIVQFVKEKHDRTLFPATRDQSSSMISRTYIFM